MMIRHAERYPILDWEKVDEPLLTDKGHADAFRLGQELAELDSVELYHSPSPRCRQTAEGIHTGIMQQNGRSRIVGHLPELAGQRIVMQGWNRVVKIVEEHGWPSFCRMWFDGELFGGLVIPLEQAASIQLRFLRAQLESGGPSKVNVTHDFMISIFREHFFGIRHDKVGLPDFLDGIVAYRTDARMHLRYHENECRIDLSEI